MNKFHSDEVLFDFIRNKSNSTLEIEEELRSNSEQSIVISEIKRLQSRYPAMQSSSSLDNTISHIIRGFIAFIRSSTMAGEFSREEIMIMMVKRRYAKYLDLINELSDKEAVGFISENKQASTGLAMQYLLLKYQSSWRQAINAKIRKWNPQNVPIEEDDLIQEALVAFIKPVRGNKYKEKGKLFPYVSTIMDRLLMNQMRKSTNNLNNVVPFSSEHDQLESNLLRPDLSLINLEEYDILLECIGKLTKQEQELVRLRFYEGKKHKEIAAELGRTESSIKVSVFKCRKLLRACLVRKLNA